MVPIEQFADEAGLIVRIERLPHAIAWTASFHAESDDNSTIWIKQHSKPALAMAAAAQQALDHLILLCRGKTLVISREGREQYVPADLVSRAQ